MLLSNSRIGLLPNQNAARRPARQQGPPGCASIKHIVSHRNSIIAKSALDSASTFLTALAESSTQPHPGFVTSAAITSVVFTAGWKVLRKGLTPTGVAHSWFLGTSIYSAFGPGGFLLVCFYFLFGTLVTKVKLEQKQKEGIAEARSGQRGPGSVWGSGLAGTACALAALATGNFTLFQIGFVASFTSKLSDTVSSEIGKAYGRTTYLITSLQPVPRGTEGAVSLEGTLAGIGAAGGYSVAALLLNQVSAEGAVAVAVAAVVANTFESYLGAKVQGNVEWLSNDVVNMIQISVAAALAIAGSQLLHLPSP